MTDTIREVLGRFRPHFNEEDVGHNIVAANLKPCISVSSVERSSTMDVGLNDFARRDAVMPEHRWNRFPKIAGSTRPPCRSAAADATTDEVEVDTRPSMVGIIFRTFGSIRRH